MHEQMAKWNERHQEINTTNKVPKHMSSANAEVVVDHRKNNGAEFLNMDKLTCLLCERQFKSSQILTRHSEESELHKVHYSVCEHVGRQTLPTVPKWRLPRVALP
jgi:hypothetical protein